MAGLGGAVPRDAPAEGVRAQRGGGQGGGAGDHPVEDDRDPQRGRAEDESGDRGVLQPPTATRTSIGGLKEPCPFGPEGSFKGRVG